MLRQAFFWVWRPLKIIYYYFSGFAVWLLCHFHVIALTLCCSYLVSGYYKYDCALLLNGISHYIPFSCYFTIFTMHSAAAWGMKNPQSWPLIIQCFLMIWGKTMTEPSQVLYKSYNHCPCARLQACKASTCNRVLTQWPLVAPKQSFLTMETGCSESNPVGLKSPLKKNKKPIGILPRV